LFIPIALALILKLLLTPAARLLHRIGLPRPLAALVVLAGLIACGGMLIYALSAPATGWLARAPEALPRLEQRVATLAESLEVVKQAEQRVVAATGGDRTPQVAVKGPGLEGLLFDSTRALLTALASMLMLLYFLLATGDLFLRRLVELLPHLH